MVVSENGFITSDIATMWIEQAFHPMTEEKAGNEWRLLLLDGHSSHYANSFLQFALAHKIAVLAYPSHCTHALQSMSHSKHDYINLLTAFECLGLDVCGFGQFKRRLMDAHIMHASQGIGRIDKTNILEIIAAPFEETFTPETILRGFELTGVSPYNPSVIPLAMLAPSKPSSSNQIFPGFDPPEVQAMVAAFGQAKRKTPPSSPQESPSKRRRLGEIDTNIPGTLFPTSFNTPMWDITAENARIASCLSCGTSAQSILSESTIEEGFQMKEPTLYVGRPFQGAKGFQPKNNLKHCTNNELSAQVIALREKLHQLLDANHVLFEFNQKATVQLVLQHLAFEKLTSQKQTSQGSGAKRQHRIFPKGKAVLLTSPDVMQLISQKQATEDKAEDEKAKWKEVREERNKLQERIEEAKRLFKEMCAAEILAWEEIDATLVAQGVPKSKRPPKPRCWKVRTKPWQRLDDELKALKLRSPKELESVEIVEEQD